MEQEVYTDRQIGNEPHPFLVLRWMLRAQNINKELLF